MERESNPASNRNDIAVIGMACRFPGARDYEQFWDNLIAGRSSIQEIPKERWDWQAYWGDPQKERNKSNSKWGGFIQDADAFDPGFFGLSAREVEATDPQQRIMMELTWSCLEDAGVRPSRISGEKVGVYVGVFNFDYKGLQESKERTIETYHSIGTASAVIANRISYYYNLKGPSFPIDTACSSSFNAIHAAAQSLLLGECEMALAGGISLILTPSRHISFSKAGMLSPTGSCKTFDDSADGYVRSEGAGVVLLKPLERALKDGDPIYGVLKGSAVNHNGKTHTLTYPNPDAQAEVIAEAHKRAGVPIESIGYIEAHGTGTPKGDPMEFKGLLQAFQMLGVQERNTNYCGLGSVKTNIGHLESAAGMAGLIKVLLSMKHKQLPGLHNFQKLNHRISIEASPFYIVDKLREWEQLRGVDDQLFPRRAGISSFGFGGTNAHVVVEEAPAIERAASGSQLPAYLIGLSAKTEEALRKRMLDLADWLDRNGQEHALADISATLLLRRDHFGIRAAFVVQDAQELREKLGQVLDKGEADGYFTDHVPFKGAQDQGLFEQLGATVVQQLRSAEGFSAMEYTAKLQTLAALYVKGHEADWQALFPDASPRHVHLPTYPFARERYWIPEEEEEAGVAAASGGISAALHPLLHRNTSDFSEQRFSSTFAGTEFFLKDHIVKGKKVLPGVAYVEMARAAVVKAAGLSDKDAAAISMHNVVWSYPIALLEQPVHVHIRLFPEEDGTIEFEIYSGSDESGAEPTVHSQGIAAIRSIGSIDEIPSFTIQALMAGCVESPIAAAQYYESFRAAGLDYGAAHQGIDRVFIGDGRVLAKLILPPAVRNTGESFDMHPSLMDSALQAALILMGESGLTEHEGFGGNKAAVKLFLPFALQELHIVRRCETVMWALVQHHGGESAGERAAKVDIDLIDEQGRLCVRLIGLSWRAADETASNHARTKIGTTFMLQPSWQERELDPESAMPQYDEHLVVLCDMDDDTGKQLEKFMNGSRILHLQAGQGEVEDRFTAYAAALFEQIQRLLKDRAIGSVLVQVVVAAAAEQHQLLSGLSGLLRTAGLEHPKFVGQMIEIERGLAPEGLAERLAANSRIPAAERVRYQAGKRQTIGWDEVAPSGTEERVPWKDGGVYLITGGTGGLGFLFAREIAERAGSAALILAGRSPLDAAKRDKLDELRRLGAKAEYRQADVTNDEGVNQLFHGLKAEFGQLNGIIHCAGLIKDNYILKKTAAELDEVLAPKVAGTVNLDRASQDMNLDFFILFSSVFGAMGNPGQADYCTANAFMDAYAGYRNALTRSNLRSGRTLSVNWPLWKDGGMHVDADTEKLMLSQLGMAAMDTHAGISAFYRAWSSGSEQVLIAQGDPGRFYARLTGQETNRRTAKGANAAEDAIPAPGAGGAPAIDAAGGELLEQAARHLTKLISGVLKLPAQRIDADAPMENYGIDSIMTTQLTNELEKTFGSLSKTLFFEYYTIRELAGYFLNAFPDKMMELLGAGSQEAAAALQQYPPVTETKLPSPLTASRKRPRWSSGRAAEDREQQAARGLDVAIIGVSGRYPGAGNMREFWDVLRSGKDCITEIPGDRWDYRRYYDEDRNKPGTTYSKWGGFLDGVDRFDPLFFNISPREAELMDPQERLFLQCVYESIEDAGYTRDSLAANGRFGLEGNVGVYVGVMYEEYQLYGAQQQMAGNPVAMFGLPASIANRVSYFCNFHGPSMSVDTMCSSSLTAIHLACHSLLRGECEVAVAGGVNVSIHPNKYLFLSQGKFISGKGRCESFGQGGDGYVPGEGVGAVLLKPLSQAVADGDHIYGVIKATAINHGGKTNGYTVPNPNAQASVIGRAFKEAGIDPRAISYVEAHGTGTSLGDPIEMAGLSQVFGQYTSDKQFCSIGSVKSNIGHCESAAGIAGLTKVLLQLQHGQLVPSLHSKVLNPNIDFANTPFVVQQELSEWRRPVLDIDGVKREYPRIAGISSFGAGGSNAHLVIEEYIPRAENRAARVDAQHPAILVLSAKSEAQLKERARRLLAAISERPFDDARLADIAYTLQLGREAMEERLAFLAASMQELEEKLKGYIQDGDQADGVYYGQVKRNKEALAVFTRDEELEEAIGKWMQRQKYDKLISLWVKGLHVDWTKLYGADKPRRISLPAYPFAQERFWVPGLDTTSDGIAAQAAAGRDTLAGREQANMRRACFLTKQWEMSGDVATRPVSGTVAILTTKETMPLAVRVSGHFAMSSIIDIQDLAQELRSTNQMRDWDLYAGCVDLIGCGSGGIDQDAGEAWLAWLQGLVEHGKREGLTLLGVSKGLEPFCNEAVRMSGADRAGLYRMLQNEYGRLSSRHMDLDPSSGDAESAEQIAAELFADCREAEVCFRNGIRYRSFLAELETRDGGRQPYRFPDGHVLWITGGTRGIGLLCAEHFVKRYGVKKLVLTGRETLPPRDQWRFYEGQQSSTADKIRAVLALEEQQAEVAVLSADLTDEEDLRRRISEVTRTIGPIGGVIHSAGVIDADTPAFIRKSASSIRQVMEPKVSGLQTLYRSVKDEPLTFFLLFSSVSSIVPALAAGQSDYSMANAYMDYFAEAEAGACPMISIQWPSWKETGMGEIRSRAYEQTGLLSMTNAEGLELLDQVLSGRMGPVVMPAVVQPELWRPGRLMQRTAPDNQPARRQAPAGVKPAGADSDSLLSRTQHWLLALLAEELKIDASRLELDTDFQDYGVDSIMFAQLLRKMNQRLDEELDPSVLFEHPNIESLGAWLVRSYSAKLAEVLAAPDRANTAQAVPAAVPAAIPAAVRAAAPAASADVPDSDATPVGSIQNTGQSGIAVVGMSCRFPGAESLDDYWKLLSEGRSAVGPVPFERWGHANSYYAGLLRDIATYDPSYFLISDEDAKAMDPQALLVLEESLKLLCHAGYSGQEIKGKPVGVYLGARSRHQPDNASLHRARNPIVAVGPNYLAANISQFFDLRGPSVVLDTACSSALVAMNMAIQALYAGDVEAAIVGGASLLATDEAHRIFEQRGILSPGPDFHLFDRRAGGVVLGEGAGMVLLKTVEQALADGDRIYAVIRGIAVNNDGRTAGPATPNIQAHKQVLQTALRKSGRKPEQIRYVETNGSGTIVTDLLELKALQSVYRASGALPLGLGSMKPNIGHPLCAEGIASFIKVVLMMQYKRMVPFLSGEEPMAHFDINGSPFYFNSELTEWTDSPRIAAVNCFADGGTNAHVIVEEWAGVDEGRTIRASLPLPALNRRRLGEGGAVEQRQRLQATVWETFG